MTHETQKGNQAENRAFSFASTALRLTRLLTPAQTITQQTARISEILREAAFLSPEAALVRMQTRLEGLTADEAEERQEQWGMNRVVGEHHRSVPQEILRLLVNPLNIMLLALSLVNFVFLNDIESGAVVTAMVVLSVTLSFIQEHRSSNAAEKLRAMVSTTASVLRQSAPTTDENGIVCHDPRKSQRMEIPVEEIVPGDVIWLSAGDIIPADVRILSARDLFLNQSALTGESMPTEKFPTQPAQDVRNFLDLNNIAFMGSHVTSGTAQAVVIATGVNSYFGTLAGTIVGPRQKTSFEKGIQRFTWLMIRFMLVMVPLVFLINGITKHNWTEALIFAMSVAVGLTPEMLPMIVTVNLSKGALAMSRKKVIVKRLNSIQNFGAMDVLCTDKTGTLTQDKVIMKRHVDLKGEDCDSVLNYAYLNSYYQSGLKNLLDIAVLEHVDIREDLHIDDQAYSKVDEIPFDFVRRRMSVVVSRTQTKEHILICKGAVEEIISVCTHGELNGVPFDMTLSHRDEMLQLAKELNEDGFRVIAVAHKDMRPDHEVYSVKDECDLTLLGFIAFLDPPKESARAAIAALHNYGVKVKILTGDNDIVTRKICKDVDLTIEGLLLGSDIEQMTDVALAQQVEHTTVFAKLSPAQKARVIGALHTNGHVVGFLGDGINDGPALKAADVGISVDTAADIAKESADIILLEKSLLVLEEGVLEGRKVFGNIVKYIRMGASSNFGNMFSVLGASAWLPFLPMLPIQILTNNLLYDFSQAAIPTDHIDDEYLRAPRKWDIGHIAKFVLCMGPVSSLFDYATFAVMYYMFSANAPEQAGTFQTAWFIESLLSQTLIIHVIRTNKIPFLQSRASWPLITTTGVISVIGLWLITSPFAHSLGFVSLPWMFWPVLALIIICYMLLANFVKNAFIKRFGWG